jgi:hypothetical protein
MTSTSAGTRVSGYQAIRYGPNDHSSKTDTMGAPIEI